MTEEKWLACADPDELLDFLRITEKVTAGPAGVLVQRRLKVSERKLRLFAVACCRLVWLELTDQRSRTAVIVAERYADGQSSAEELHTARVNASIRFGAGNEVGAAREVAGDVAYLAAYQAHAYTYDPHRKIEGKREKANLLRDIVGNLFRPVTVDPYWLAWNDGTLPNLAQAIYQERAFDRLPILADALEDAGCSDPQFLAHCRGPGPHVRGCWVVDLLLGKK
jgi:hypothetical protein